MSLSIWLEETGGPEVLKAVDARLVGPAANEVVIKQEAIGVNYLDVTQRRGDSPIPLPSGLGLEGAGVVEEIGSGVSDFAVGDRVAYVLGPLGAYAASRTISVDRLIRVPDDMSLDSAGTLLLKGITAQYLLTSTYKVGPGTVALLYGVGGALGQFMTPWAKHLGATVIGVVSKDASVERAKALGCDDVLVWGTDLAKRVNEVTKGRKVDVVYDGLGQLSFVASLDSLKPRGLMVSLGASTGSPPPFDLKMLVTKGSLFLTRPSLAAHATNIAEYRQRAADVIDAAAEGIFSTKIWREFPLKDAAAAHEALESGQSAGPIILKP
ncbi:quinone oxidoreductase [Rhizobium sp. 2YAF20]|uniref:quinone oxidoreductase family protein n=1 Tax=Rhizobium sp. 2YAF20 TaxID=3233027 RepID=UPI003F99EE0B